MQEEKHLLFFENQPVGWIVVKTMDMWYWDCEFEGLDNPHSDKFMSDASSL